MEKLTSEKMGVLLLSKLLVSPLTWSRREVADTLASASVFGSAA
ncbi:hypothetical protein AALB_1782 [Agarivorans albus MKT 106]|uniref:Uncharacterized protein n=1 Tax=Agarivorans albus MKT 106 TaxID=1331007 RepID=R9PK24_AGAAL|nr:hypothetical protein AALB_1782 [Agarivorans albus MKT 106]